MGKPKLNKVLQARMDDRALSMNQVSLKVKMPLSSLSYCIKNNKYPKKDEFKAVLDLLELESDFAKIEEEYQLAWAQTRKRRGANPEEEMFYDFFRTVLSSIPPGSSLYIENFGKGLYSSRYPHLLVLLFEFMEKHGGVLQLFITNRGIQLTMHICMFAFLVRFNEKKKAGEDFRLDVLAEEILKPIYYGPPYRCVIEYDPDGNEFDEINNKLVLHALASPEDPTERAVVDRFREYFRMATVTRYLCKTPFDSKVRNQAFALGGENFFGQLGDYKDVEDTFQFYRESGLFSLAKPQDIRLEDIIDKANEYNIEFKPKAG